MIFRQTVSALSPTRLSRNAKLHPPLRRGLLCPLFAPTMKLLIVSNEVRIIGSKPAPRIAVVLPRDNPHS